MRQSQNGSQRKRIIAVWINKPVDWVFFCKTKCYNWVMFELAPGFYSAKHFIQMPAYNLSRNLSKLLKYYSACKHDWCHETPFSSNMGTEEECLGFYLLPTRCCVQVGSVHREKKSKFWGKKKKPVWSSLANQERWSMLVCLLVEWVVKKGWRGREGRMATVSFLWLAE